MAKNNIPQIRFKGFDGEWKEKKFNDRFLEFTEKTTSENEDVLLSSSINGMFLNSELFSHQRGSSNKGYLKIKLGTMILSAQNLHLGNANVNLRFNHGIISPAYKTYNILEDNIAYVNAWLKRDNTNKMFFDCTTEGASLCRRNIDWDELYNQYISSPLNSEQARIASLFTTLDKQISCSEEKLDKLRVIKKTLLKKMFVSTGEKTPQIRFKGFDGEWEEKKFSNITYSAGKKNKENLPLESYSITNENGFVPQNEKFEKGGNMTTADKSMYYIVEKDSFAYNPARINVGSIGYYNGENDVIVSSLYEVFKTTDDVNDRFLWHWLKSDHFNKKILQFQEGGVRLYFYYDKLCMCSIYMSYTEEQERIGKLIDTLDKQISVQEEKTEKLKAIKKTLLKKMFV
jgi:type I restriction enzyme S subunit